MSSFVVEGLGGEEEGGEEVGEVGEVGGGEEMD